MQVLLSEAACYDYATQYTEQRPCNRQFSQEATFQTVLCSQRVSRARHSQLSFCLAAGKSFCLVWRTIALACIHTSPYKCIHVYVLLYSILQIKY